jgi:hypothetical protein
VCQPVGYIRATDHEGDQVPRATTKSNQTRRHRRRSDRRRAKRDNPNDVPLNLVKIPRVSITRDVRFNYIVVITNRAKYTYCREYRTITILLVEIVKSFPTHLAKVKIEKNAYVCTYTCKMTLPGLNRYMYYIIHK